MSELKINADGSLKLPLAIRHQLGSKPLQPLSSSAGHLLLGKSGLTNPVLLAGVLGEISVPDLLSFFNMFRKTGILHFELENGSKALYFQKGEIVFATSTIASEDLGEILFALGKIEREPLQQARQSLNKTLTLGKLLVERGIVSPKDLWQATRSQVEGIVYRLFAAQQGSFYYELRALDQEQMLRLSMSTQNLIMEGLRRQDEEALFMRKVISIDYYPVPTGKVLDELPQMEARLMQLAEAEQQTARVLFRRAGLSEFDGIRTLYALLEKRLLLMEDAPATEIAGELGQILLSYNNLFKVIYRCMEQQQYTFSQEVAGILLELPQPYSFVLRDVELLEDGTLDGHRIVANLGGLEEGDKQKLLADSLRELIFSQAMTVRRELDAEQARPLLARIQEVTTRVRDLVGRCE